MNDDNATISLDRVHPAGELFPLLQGDEFDALVADIEAHGLIEALWVLPDRTLLDGRNRLRACEQLGIETRHRVYEGDDPIAFVMSLNLARRHLTTGQIQFVGLEVRPL